MGNTIVHTILGIDEGVHMPVASINGHSLYYEYEPRGDQTVLCMGGWGTYCHGDIAQVPDVLRAEYSLLCFDYRGIGDSSDSPDGPATMADHARDAIALTEHLGIDRLHVVGLIGMGACIGQHMALQRPDLVRSLFMTGTWAYVDDALRDQLQLFAETHERLGFEEFQKLCAVFSFPATFYSKYRDRLLSAGGAWKHLRDNVATHRNLVDACLGHDVRDQLARIDCPTLVIHAGRDPITGPDHTRVLESAIPNAKGLLVEEFGHVPAGSHQLRQLNDVLVSWLAECSAARP